MSTTRSNRQPTTFDDLPGAIHYVWHGVNDRANLRQFLCSPVQWAELDVNLGPDGRTLILRHDTYAELRPSPAKSLCHGRSAAPAKSGREVDQAGLQSR